MESAAAERPKAGADTPPAGELVGIAELAGVLGSYLKPEDIAQVLEAFEFSRDAHAGQYRKSGEPYISHPVAVATVLAQWHLDAQALSSALLHDVVEDTPTTGQQIAERFGKTVAELVDGLSKLDKLSFQTETHAQAENFRKMLLAMARDVRVILVKIADRLHNMRTLDAMEPARRRRIARETLEIYAPIANRLGLNEVFHELEDLSFRHLYPTRYGVLAKAVRAARGNRKEVVAKVQEAILGRLRELGVEATVGGREKHLYSIYNKMHGKSLPFAEVFDVYGFRVLVKDVPACYLALGALHGLYKPIPGKFKDYIAIPKANGYQSLHTTLFGPFGTPLEVQIRTQEMHKLAEAGVASHWLYKSGSLNDAQQRTHQWLKSLLEIQSESGDSIEFLEHIKVDLFPDEVYVFTPAGEIKALPRGATAVDFAYSVHTDVGNRCVAANINHELAPLRTPLKNGDRVEIVTAAGARPNPAWLRFVITGKARSHIRHYLKTLHFDESAALGLQLLTRALEALQSDLGRVDEARWEKFLRDTGAKSRQEVLADIGLGKRLAWVVARRLLADPDAPAPARPLSGAFTIRGTEGISVQLARCCTPIPGDPILGYIKKGQGLLVHTHDCPAIRHYRDDPDKWLDVEWDPEARRMFRVNIKLIVLNQRGVLARVAAEIAQEGSNINNVLMEDEDGGNKYTSMAIDLSVENRAHLARILKGLRCIPEVVRINRVRGGGG